MTNTNEAQLYTAAGVADLLHISPDTLRRWTREFAAQLSASAVGSGYYRYGAADIKRLQTIHDLLAEGRSIAEVANHLTPAASAAAAAAEPAATAPEEPGQGAAASNSSEHAALVIQPDENNSQNPGSMVLREVLTGFAAGQEAILNSQQANRNLMGVVIQDNFNLKEENARLRERMLKLEQELSEIHRLQLEQRQQLEQRMRQVENKKDWLSRLLGF